MSAEFPRAELIDIARLFRPDSSPRKVIDQAIASHEQLAHRCVMDATEASLEIANLRARLREIDPQFPTP